LGIVKSHIIYRYLRSTVYADIDLNVVLLLGTTAAYAGGMDRSGQSITALFEEGTYAEISFGSIDPSVTGTGIDTAVGTTTTTAASGNVAGSYTQIGLAYKTDLNDDW
jgi:long-chain fatty acid transport protein